MEKRSRKQLNHTIQTEFVINRIRAGRNTFYSTAESVKCLFIYKKKSQWHNIHVCFRCVSSYRSLQWDHWSKLHVWQTLYILIYIYIRLFKQLIVIAPLSCQGLCKLITNHSACLYIYIYIAVSKATRTRYHKIGIRRRYYTRIVLKYV